MAIVSLATLKNYFLTNKVPTQSQYGDLVDTLGQLLNANGVPNNNLKTVSFTIGTSDVTGVNYNFSSVDNTTKQSIQLGLTTIIPANCPIIQAVVVCTASLVGGTTSACELGYAAGNSAFGSLADMDTLADIFQGGNGNNIFSSASSVYFGLTPSANWNTLTLGSWKVWISYIDNSQL